MAAWDEFLEQAELPQHLRNSSFALEDPDGVGPRIFFQQVPEGKVAKNRVQLDVRTASDLRGEERMAALETECLTRVQGRHTGWPPSSPNQGDIEILDM